MLRRFHINRKLRWCHLHQPHTLIYREGQKSEVRGEESNSSRLNWTWHTNSQVQELTDGCKHTYSMCVCTLYMMSLSWADGAADVCLLCSCFTATTRRSQPVFTVWFWLSAETVSLQTNTSARGDQIKLTAHYQNNLPELPSETTNGGQIKVLLPKKRQQ